VSLRPRCSYVWALQTDLGNVPLRSLSAEASVGLRLARQLAEDAKERVQQNIRGGERFAPLTIGELAELEGLSPATVRRRISRARQGLFGEISDSAIRKRRMRRRQRQERPRQPCREPDCERWLGPQTHGNRDYCEEHAHPSAHVRRYRERRKQT
jgi:DNA-binding transcriptional ArsR family regulator